MPVVVTRLLVTVLLLLLLFCDNVARRENASWADCQKCSQESGSHFSVCLFHSMAQSILNGQENKEDGQMSMTSKSKRNIQESCLFVSVESFAKKNTRPWLEMIEVISRCKFHLLTRWRDVCLSYSFFTLVPVVNFCCCCCCCCCNCK